MADQTHFDDDIVNDFLQLLFRCTALCQVALSIDIEECIPASCGHCCTILFLQGCCIRQPTGLDCLLEGCGRLPQVNAIAVSHDDHVCHGLHLHADLRSLSHGFWSAALNGCVICLLTLEQLISSIERNAAVVPDDAASGVRVGKAGKKVGVPCQPHFLRVEGEDEVVVRLHILRVGLLHLRIWLEAIALQSRLHSAPTSPRLARTSQRCVCLQSNHHILLSGKHVARLVRCYGRSPLCVHIEDAALGALLFHELFAAAPCAQGSLSCGCQEGLIAVVPHNVLSKEALHIAVAWERCWRDEWLACRCHDFCNVSLLDVMGK
mmetsp:Transcript_40390/g.94944  ORF Transcript_40390/g.94944 Transcript_40390/m.94944 type:complete len:321 (+) Transcript_40390:1685-2647(+)